MVTVLIVTTREHCFHGKGTYGASSHPWPRQSVHNKNDKGEFGILDFTSQHLESDSYNMLKYVYKAKHYVHCVSTAKSFVHTALAYFKF